MVRLFFVGALALLIVWGGLVLVSLPQDHVIALSGPVRVIDGDTIDVGTTRVRLHGIDAPEMSQTCSTDQNAEWKCGQWVRDQLKARIQGRNAECDNRGSDRYGRVIAVCRVDGRDIARDMVRDGLAFAYRRYSLTYVKAEKAAESAGRGLWQSVFQSPEEFRHSRSF